MLDTSFIDHLIFARANPGRRDQLGERLASLLQPTRAAMGCVRFTLQHSLSDPDLWVLAGTWRGPQAMQSWFGGEQASLFDQLVQSRLISSLDFNTFTTVEVDAHDGTQAPWWLKVS